MIPWLEPGDPFPPVDEALRQPNGLLAAGGDLSAERLLAAYERGIFPWFNDDEPVLWWSPDPRMVLAVDEVRVSRSLRKVIRARRFDVTFDRAFRDVMLGCAGPRQGQHGTWITDDMLEAYVRLAASGHAHSVEVWHEGALAGGLYGVAIGRMFFGESMFTRQADASKVALVYLAGQLRAWRFRLIDCQMSTAHLASLGAREIPRARFLAEIARLVRQPSVPGPWQLEVDAAALLSGG